jgi:hypothetical protein
MKTATTYVAGMGAITLQWSRACSDAEMPSVCWEPVLSGQTAQAADVQEKSGVGRAGGPL